MIRLTFVTGAGKLGRSKYDENAAKSVTGALRELGYVEDRGASAVMECQGSFKLQHDTGKNLKTVVVFPKMASTDSLENGLGSLKINGNHQPLLAENSIQHKLAMAPKSIFTKMVDTKCPTWTQRKGCMVALNEIKSLAESIDQKLLTGKPLDDAEQEFYDRISMALLDEKITANRAAMQGMVDEGRINKYDHKLLLEQVSERISALESDISQAQQQGKSKRVENLQAALAKAQTRKSKIQSINPKPLPPLQNHAAIAKLRKEMEPILAMEASAKGRLLSLKESQAVSHKEELQEEIESLQVCCHCFPLIYQPLNIFRTVIKQRLV